MTLATLAQLKSQLGIINSETKYDAKLSLYLNAASDWVETYCDRKFGAANYIEILSGNRSNFLNIDQWPLISVSELRVSASRDWASESSLIPSTSYGITGDKVGVTYYQGFFPKGYDNIRISYRAGYESIPADLQLGVIWAAEWFYLHNNRGDSGRTTASKQGESVGVLSDVPPMCKSIIDAYRRLDMAAPQIGINYL